MSTELRWAFNATKWQPTMNELLKALSGISTDECDRIQQFRFKEDFKLSLVGRLMIRKAIQKVTKIEWNDIMLNRTTKGKPTFHNIPDENVPFYFNVSHDGDYTVLAACTDHNIGIDIMKYTRPNNTDIPSFFKLMKRQFVDEEWKYINNFETEVGQLKAFYRLWCLKESYVKALGVGIGTNSAEYMRFHISEETDVVATTCCSSELYVKGESIPWSFHEHLLDNDHVVAVATEEERRNVSNEHVCKPFQYLSFGDVTCDLKALQSVDVKLSQIMDEFSLCFSDPLHIDMMLFSEWLDGYSEQAAAKTMCDTVSMTDVPYGIIQQEVEEQYTLFGFLQHYLQAPQLLNSPMFSSLSHQQKEQLLEHYYKFDKVVMREILGKRMNAKLRKDMEDVSEKTKITLRSCRRQFDNVKNILKTCEDMEGSLLAVLKEQFMFSETLIKQYYPLVFVFLARFETTKKRQQFLSYDNIIKSSECILEGWTVNERNGPDKYMEDEIDRNFIQDLRDLRNFTSDKEFQDAHKSCALLRLEKKATTLHFTKSVEVNFKNISRSIFSLGGGLSHTRDFRDFFVDCVEKIIDPIKQLEWAPRELEVMLDVIIDSWTDLPDAYQREVHHYDTLFRRFMLVMKNCLLQLYS